MRYNPADGPSAMRRQLLLLVLPAMLAARARADVVDARPAERIPDSALGADFAGWETDAAVSTRAAALVDAYAGAGVKWARVLVEWSAVETSTGVRDDADVDALIQALFDRGVKVLMTLDGRGQKLYADGSSPTAENGALAPWLAWVSSTTARYATAVSAWQVWDRPDRDWKPDISSAAYAALFRPTADAIRAARPGAVVLLGGVADANREFLRGAAAAVDGRADGFDLRRTAGGDSSDALQAVNSVRDLLATGLVPRPAVWIGPDSAVPAADADGPDAPPAESATVRAKRLARADVLALAAGAARRFAAPDLDAASGAPSPAALTVLRSLAALFDDRVAGSASLTASFNGAPPGLLVFPFATRSGVSVLAFWRGGAPSEDDPGRPAVLSLSQPVRDPVLLDPLSGEVSPLGSGTLTTVSVPVRDYPLLVTGAAVLNEAASVVLVPAETEAFPSPVRGGEDVSVRYFLTRPASVAIEIFTSRRELLRSTVISAPVGRGEWKWTADVGAGAYYWRVTAAGQSLVGRIEVLR
jgi:hypothetical protein